MTILIAALVVLAWRRYRTDRRLLPDLPRGARPDPLPGRARRPHGREGPEGGAGRGSPRRRDAADRPAPLHRPPQRDPRRGGAGGRRSRRAPSGRGPFERSRSARRSPRSATIVAGGYMSASELHGTPEEHAAVDPHTACGTDFPGCAGGGPCPSGAAARSTSTSPTARSCTSRSRSCSRCSRRCMRQRRRLDPSSSAHARRRSAAIVGVLACPGAARRAQRLARRARLAGGGAPHGRARCSGSRSCTSRCSCSARRSRRAGEHAETAAVAGGPGRGQAPDGSRSTSAAPRGRPRPPRRGSTARGSASATTSRSPSRASSRCCW